MGRKSRGLTVIPNDSSLWQLSVSELGMLLRVHRALQLRGDRDASTVPQVVVDALCDTDMDNDALHGLYTRGLIADIGDQVIVASWEDAQGKADRRTRRHGQRRAKKHRERERNALQRTTARRSNDKQPSAVNAARVTRDDQRNGIQPGNSTKSQGKARDSGEAHDPLLSTSSRSGSSLDPEPGSFSSKPDPRSPKLITHGNGIDQGDMFAHDELSAEARGAVEVWTTVEPLSRIKDLGPFIEKALRAYPKVNLREQAHLIAVWWDANPSKRKSDRGLKRFVNSWLARAQRNAVEAARETERQRNKRDPTASTVAAIWDDDSNRNRRRPIK
jgi:hypothetical protein